MWRRKPAGKVCPMSVMKVADPGATECTGSQDRVPPCPGVRGVQSLEVRWIFAGRPPPVTAAWIGRFPARTVVLEDAYLVNPYLPGLSVQVREGRAFEVKEYHGSPGLMEVPGCARGRLESWRKWSFPCDPACASGDLAGWRTVRKTRRISRFSRAGYAAAAGARSPGERAGCAVELSEFRALGEDWWTLGFEATGPPAVLRGQLEAAAALVFGQVLPDEVELDLGDCMSYAQWLRR
jgi:hypothetical protein